MYRESPGGTANNKKPPIPKMELEACLLTLSINRGII